MVLTKSACRWMWCAALWMAAQGASAQFSHAREQIQIDITVTAEAGVNPDGKGRAAPVLVRVYELKSQDSFEAADYFSLAANDKAVIGADLLVRDEFTRREHHALSPDSHVRVGGALS